MSSGLSVGSWWRARRYEILAGYIRPVVSERPAESYAVTRPAGRELVYQELLELGAEAVKLDRHAPLPQVLEQRLTRWCARHGLLGLLPQETLMVSFGARPYRLTDEARRSFAGFGRGPAPEWLTLTRCFHRDRDEWRETIEFPDFDRDASESYRAVIKRPNAIAAVGQPVRPGVVGGSFAIGNFEQSFSQTLNYGVMSIGKAWGRFFPDIPVTERETWAYPPPLSKEFWDAYAEPVWDILDAAVAFHNVVTLYKVEPKNTKDLRELVASRHIQRITHGTLDCWLNSCSPRLRHVDGQLVAQLVAPSLLATFALFFYEDLLAGRFPRSCKNERCGVLFVPNSPREEYHRKKCKLAAKKRRHRRRRRERASGSKPRRRKRQPRRIVRPTRVAAR